MSANRFGPYRLVEELGSGAQATVHLAEVVEAREGLEPGDRVALKVLHEHLGEEGGAVERFDREVRLLKAVNHDNVLRLLDAGVLQNGHGKQYYLATELVEGVTLRDLLEEDGPQSEALCRYVGRSLAQGLAAIHAVAAVHRDLKPENVILTKDQRVKVMDLGVALLRDDLRVSKTGEFVGSILYAAPEQFVTHKRRVDGRADLYSLGLILYEMLTGRHPFDGEGLAAIMAQHLKGEPPRPSRFAPTITPFFETFLLGLLSKLPSDRPQDALIAAEALEAGEASTWWRGHERLHLARARVFRPAAPREYALCGRQDELERLDALWQRARAGEGRAVLLLGEAGIGKTRLFDEFAEGLHVEGEEFHYLAGSSFSGGAATATGAFTSAYVDFFGTSELEASLEPLLVDAPALVAPFADFLRGAPPASGQQLLSTDGLHTAYIRVAQTLATQRPTLLVLDDLHFAPQEGHALFAALAQAIAGHPILLVGLSRPGLPADWRANLQRLPHVSTMELERLDADHVEALVGEALGGGASTRALGARLTDLTDGNPFFLLETLRAQRESGALEEQGDGTWRLRTRAEDLHAPAVVKDLIEARVADLDTHDRDTLDLAAVVGFRFDPAIVAEVLDSPRLPVLRDLSRLERTRHIIVADGRAYRFDHHLVQEILYALVPELLRREYHAAIGTVLRTRLDEAGERPEAEALTVEACHHLLRGDRGGQALRILDRAGTYLDGQHMHEAAARLLEDVLGVAGLVEGRRRAELLLARIRHLQVVGWTEARAAALLEARRIAATLTEQDLLADAETMQADHHVNTGAWDEAMEAIERAAIAADNAADPVRIAKVLNTRGSVLLHKGRMEEAARTYQQGLDLCVRLGRAPEEAQARCNMARPLAALGKTEAAYDAYRMALAIFREIGDERAESVAAGNFGSQLQLAGRYEESEPLLRRCLELSRKIGYRYGEANALGNLGLMHYSCGHLADALEHLERSEALMTEMAYGPQRIHLVGTRGLVHARLGHFPVARRLLDEARRGWALLGATSQAALIDCWSAQVLSDSGDVAGAVSLLERALDEATTAESEYERGVVEGCLGAALLAAGQRDEALPHLERAAREADDRDVELLASLAALGRHDAALVEAMLDARGAEEECHSRMGAHLWLGRATGKPEHYEQAYELLQHLVRHAPEADRSGLADRVPLYREIQSAWREHGGAPQAMPDD